MHPLGEHDPCRDLFAPFERCRPRLYAPFRLPVKELLYNE